MNLMPMATITIVETVAFPNVRPPVITLDGEPLLRLHPIVEHFSAAIL